MSVRVGDIWQWKDPAGGQYKVEKVKGERCTLSWNDGKDICEDYAIKNVLEHMELIRPGVMENV